MPGPQVRIRPGEPGDADVLVSMFDDAVAWLSARGRGGQWGERPWSEQPARVTRIHQLAAEEELWVAEADAAPAGALILAEHPPSYVAPVDERELYVLVLITARAQAGRAVGAGLLDHARGQAVGRGIGLLRVDCWAGGDGALVAYYTRAGFTPTVGVDVDGWPGQVFEQRLPASPG